MELQLFGKGLGELFSSRILYLAVSSPGHRLVCTWLLTVLAFELHSLCCGWSCHFVFCKNYSVITLRQEMVELSQHSAFWFMLLPPTLPQSSDLQLHYFWVNDLGIFWFLNAKECAKGGRQCPIFAKSSSAACAELLCMKNFKLFHSTVCCCFIFPLHLSIDNGRMNKENVTRVEIPDACVLLLCWLYSSVGFFLLYLHR